MRIIAALFIFTFLTACSDNKIDTKAEGEKLMQISREWSRSAATDSIEKTLSYWADDAVIMSHGQPTLKGKKAIREMIEGTSKIPGFKISWEPLSVSVSKSGDMAYMIEHNQITMNDTLGKPVTEFNNVVTVWRKEADGYWKNVVESFSK
ncbi:MAG: nuclear transport factor 2 family protein [Chitinophagaceae bacterium]|nr:nuclear transport factor 2 family protein [Chitinophagaceae bacterium]